MRAVIQRVTGSRVVIENKTAGNIKKGITILLGVKKGDTEKDVKWLAEKCINLRIFENEQGKFHYSAIDLKAEVLVVSQFTLYGDCRRGRRPSFTEAAAPRTAEKLYEAFIDVIRQNGLKVETGIFGAKMQVDIENNGPVTLIIDSEGISK